MEIAIKRLDKKGLMGLGMTLIGVAGALYEVLPLALATPASATASAFALLFAGILVWKS